MRQCTVSVHCQCALPAWRAAVHTPIRQDQLIEEPELEPVLRAFSKKGGAKASSQLGLSMLSSMLDPILIQVAYEVPACMVWCHMHILRGGPFAVGFA